MKKTIRLFVLLFTLIFCFLFANSSVIAENITDISTVEGFEENAIQPRRVSCPAPDCGSLCFTLCGMEHKLDGTSTHKYGSLFDRQECTIYYYQSTSYDYCMECDSIVTSYNYHDCYISHSDCGQGGYSICYCADWP